MARQEQQTGIKELIAKGKEQSYLTYAEVNDHLPQSISDPDQVEDIIQMINDMGITVHESAPAEIDQTLSDSAVSDDEAAARSAQRLVGGRGDDVRVRHRRRMRTAGDQAGDVRHVHQQIGAHFVGDGAKTQPAHDTGIGVKAGQGHAHVRAHL
mgnify:CR=1 FL=1